MTNEHFAEFLEKMDGLSANDQMILLKCEHGHPLAEGEHERLGHLEIEHEEVRIYLDRREIQKSMHHPCMRAGPGRSSISRLMSEYHISAEQSRMLFQFLHGEGFSVAHREKMKEALEHAHIREFLWRATGVSIDVRNELTKYRAHAPTVAELAERYLTGITPEHREILVKFACGTSLSAEEYGILRSQDEQGVRLFLIAQLDSFERAMHE